MDAKTARCGVAYACVHVCYHVSYLPTSRHVQLLEARVAEELSSHAAGAGIATDAAGEARLQAVARALSLLGKKKLSSSTRGEFRAATLVAHRLQPRMLNTRGFRFFYDLKNVIQIVHVFVLVVRKTCSLLLNEPCILFTDPRI